jgi:hypothetical protein
VRLGCRCESGAGERGSTDAGESESRKLPHENILQWLSVNGRRKIYSTILNGRLPRRRIDFRHVLKMRATAAPRARHCRHNLLPCCCG